MHDDGDPSHDNYRDYYGKDAYSEYRVELVVAVHVAPSPLLEDVDRVLDTRFHSETLRAEL